MTPGEEAAYERGERRTRVVPQSPIAYAISPDTLIVHREDGARWHVQCDRFAAHLAGEEEGLFERWAARLREHREEVERARDWGVELAVCPHL